MTVALPTSQVHAVGIGDFDLAFIVRLWWCSGTPGGWMWAAIAEDDMTGWFRGEGLFPDDRDALAAAIAHLTAIFD